MHHRSRTATAGIVGLLAYCGTVAVVLTIVRATGPGAGLRVIFGAYLLGALAAFIAVRAVIGRPPPP